MAVFAWAVRSIVYLASNSAIGSLTTEFNYRDLVGKSYLAKAATVWLNIGLSDRY